MVQINLPQNSKVEKGKYFKDKTGSKNIRKVNIYRWDPSTGENPRIDTYEVDMDNCPSKVLDLLNKIKNEIDPSIAYRRSCAHGVCGSCAMNMDGKNGLACTKPHSEIKGDIFEAILLKGQIYWESEQVDHAQQSFLLAAKTNPYSWMPFFYLGEFYKHSGMY